MEQGIGITQQLSGISRAGQSSSARRQANKENYVSYAENITPIKSRNARNRVDKNAPPVQMNLDDSQTPKNITSSKTTPNKSRNGQVDSIQSYSTAKEQQDIEKLSYAKFVLDTCSHRNVDEVLAIVKPIADSASAAVAKESIETIASAMEQLLAGKLSDVDSVLPLDDLQQHIPGIAEWTNVGLEMKSKRPLYGYFSDFAIFVAHCLSTSIAEGDLARLVLPASIQHLKSNESNDRRRVNMALTTHIADTAVESCHSQIYADILCNVEAKWKHDMDDDALKQVLVYSAGIYAQQPNRRFLWGLAICTTSVYACVMLNDGVLVSSAMDIATAAGRRMLITLLVHWSLCLESQLGYDPTMRRLSDDDSSFCTNNDDFLLGGDGKCDRIRYEVDCYDDMNQETHTYITLRTIMSASSLLGRHTRCFVARLKYADSADTNVVVIKDAWPPIESEIHNEIELLRQIRNQFEINPPVHLYPRLEVGGHVQLDIDGHSAIDTTDAIFDLMGTIRREPPMDGTKGTWQQQVLRAHRRIVMSPVGRGLKSVNNEEELIIVLAEAMRCHNSILKDCGVLHRDISTNNILVVREDHSSLPRGLLIDLDFAVPVDREKRTAQPAQSGTLPYMSIANLENINIERTALDDWESLFYVICWLATFGISSSDRNANPRCHYFSIYEWLTSNKKTIADRKRSYMDTKIIFRSLIVSKFQSKYKLLRRLAINLHKALFAHVNCKGALNPKDLRSASDLSDLEESDHSSELAIDPLVARNDYVGDILLNLQDAMDKSEKQARARLAE
ncbi:hypothetical protein H4S08_004635 [Coemansia sp. RSA 1365]|nr:hypothetical protein H4S08_004635 [Coemansia sp. RSA 1365]